MTKRKREAEHNAEQRQQEASKLKDEEAFRTLLFEAVKDPSKATWGAVQVCGHRMPGDIQLLRCLRLC